MTPGRGELKPVPPGRDEHQLVRDAAGGLTHRASRRATLFAPGAGAPTKTMPPGRGELKPVPPGKDEHPLVRSAAGELAPRASWRAKLFAPGAGAPTKTITPGRGELKPVPPGRDEHQLVRDAAGELAHRASWRAKLFAPGAGAPTGQRRSGGRTHRVRSRPVCSTSPGSVFPRGVAHPRYANPSRCNPGKDEHQLVRDAAGGLAPRASRRATLFAPGAGAPTRLRCPEGRLRCPEGASLSLPYTRKMM